MADLVITIDMGSDGKPDVRWPDPDDCSQGNDKKPCVKKGRKVKWQLAEGLGGRFWAVGFAHGTPFKHGQMVFHPTDAEGKVRSGADATEYKYDIVLADEHGKLTHRDPKIMVEENGDDEDQLYAMAAWLEDEADRACAFADEAREMAGFLRDFLGRTAAASTAS